MVGGWIIRTITYEKINSFNTNNKPYDNLGKCPTLHNSKWKRSV